MNRIVALLLGLLVAFACHAGGPGAVRKQIESSMLVTGWVLIDPDGSVTKLEIDGQEKLPAGVVKLIEQGGASWRFEPVLIDGVARKAKARMSLRVVAKKVDADLYQLSIRSGYFGEEAQTPEEYVARPDAIKPLTMKPPFYPENAARMGGRGTVYVVLKIARDGSVQETFAEQVNLQVIGSENQMASMRTIFSKAALSAAKKWTFQPPVAGGSPNETGWVVRVPVEFQFHGYERPTYGQWDSYVPGPTQRAPWDANAMDEQAPDAMIAGMLYDARNSLRLLTPLHPG
jgi:TonB family protein